MNLSFWQIFGIFTLGLIVGTNLGVLLMATFYFAKATREIEDQLASREAQVGGTR